MSTLVGVRRALLGQGLPPTSFAAPLSDAGAGAVSTTFVGAPGTTSTFTRATVAWTKLATGLWAQVATGVARASYLEYSTAVGAYGGYYAENAGTQLVTPTASIRDMTNAAWTKSNMTTAQTSTGIDGVANSCTRCTASAANGTSLQTLVAAASSRTYTVWIKRVTGTGEIDIAQDGATWTNVTGLINSSTFTRVSLTASQLNASFGIRIVTSGDAIDVDFNQFEAGAFGTSPMASAGAARNGDIWQFSSAGNINTSRGSAYCQFSVPLSTATTRLIVDTANASQPLGTVTGVDVFVNDGTTSAVTATSGSRTAMNKAASTWDGAREIAYINGGGAVGAAFDGVMNMGTTFEIGARFGVSEALNGFVRDARVYPVALTPAQIAGLA